MNNTFEDTIIIDNNIIKNKELYNLVQFKLDKTEFNKEDLKDIKDIILDGKKISGDVNEVYFDEILLFNNLKSIEIKNLDITEDNIENLKNIDIIYFNNCKIECIEKIKNVKKLSINKSKIKDFNTIENFENLTELEIINIEIENFEFLKSLNNLQTLKIKNVKNFSLEKINFNLPIKYLSVDEIDVLEEDLIKNNPNLEKVSISLEKREENIEKLEKIKQKGIQVLINEIYEY